MKVTRLASKETEKENGLFQGKLGLLSYAPLAQVAPFLQLLLFSVRAILEEQQFSLNLLLSNNLQPVRNPTPSQPSAEGMFLNDKLIFLFYNIHLPPSTQRSQS